MHLRWRGGRRDGNAALRRNGARATQDGRTRTDAHRVHRCCAAAGVRRRLQGGRRHRGIVFSASIPLISAADGRPVALGLNCCFCRIPTTLTLTCTGTPNAGTPFSTSVSARGRVHRAARLTGDNAKRTGERYYALPANI